MMKSVCGFAAATAATMAVWGMSPAVNAANEGANESKITSQALRAQRVASGGPINLQAQLADPVRRATLEANIRGISVEDVVATSRRIERGAARARRAQTYLQTRAPDRSVTESDIEGLRNLSPQRRPARAPENLVPKPKRAIAPVRATPSRANPAAPGAGFKAPNTSPGGSPPAPNPMGPGNVTAPPKPYLDVNGFGEDLHAALRWSVQGYTMRMRRNGADIYTLQWNWARRPNDGDRGWNPGRRMNVASVSKFVTAIAMVDLLQRRGIDPETAIEPWLPDYWSLGPNADEITFSMLMTHASGLNNSGSTDFLTMRTLVQQGVTPNLPTRFTYENTNFGLQRILIATLGGYVQPGMNFGVPGMNDAMWDAVTTAAYTDYVEKNVFAKAGVTGASFAKNANTALAYTISGGSPWNSGDLSWRAGSGGWHLSVDDILNVARTYRYSNAIVPNSVARDAITNRFGLDGRWNTLAGFVYHKNGSWRRQPDCPVGQQQEQSLLLLMPDNMEMALLVNSPVGPNCTFLRGLVQQIFTDNIVVPDS